ncbi:MAG: DNA/RNA nuclease SfsA [Leptonema sp. (in: bacteria)]
MIQITNLQKGIFKRRYKRFFIDFLIENKIESAHCPNTGSMKSCLKENSEILYSVTDNPNRKLKYTLEFIKPNDWVLVNTQRVNTIVEFFLKIQQEYKYQYLLKEPKLDSFRPDFLLFNENHISDLTKFKLPLNNKLLLNPNYQNDLKPLFIEVKNVTYYVEEKNCLSFPDAVTIRGSKHLEHLIKLIDQGFATAIYFALSRSEGSFFCPSKDIDKNFSELLGYFYEKGGKIYPLRFSFKIYKKSFNNYTVIINFSEILKLKL